MEKSKRNIRAWAMGILLTCALFAVALLLPAWGTTQARAETVSDDGTTVTFSGDDFKVNSKNRVTGISDDAWNLLFDNKDTLKNVILEYPESIVGMTVGCVSDFDYFDVGVSLKIPASMTSVLYGSYLNEMKVVSVTVADGNTVYSAATDGSYFVKKATETESGEVVWSNGVIPTDATVTSIGRGALQGAETVHIPANITSIASDAFGASLKSVTVAADNSAYGDGDGKNCLIDKANKTLIASPSGYIPDDGSVTNIADGALFGAENVTIPAQIESLTSGAFDSALKSLVVAPENTLYSDGGNNCFITKADKKLVFATVATNMATVFNGIEIIGTKAFTGLNITDITVPETVTQIEKGAFFGCPALESITLPFVGGHKTVEGESTAEDTVFGYIFYTGEYLYAPEKNDYIEISQSLQDVSGPAPFIKAYIPKTLKTVSVTGAGITLTDFAFGKMAETNLQNLYVPDDVIIVNGLVFGERGEVQLNKFIKSNDDGNVCLYSSEDHSRPVILIYGNTTDTLVQIPEGVTTIGIPSKNNYSTERKAYKNAKVMEVVLPSTLKSIAPDAFVGCNDLAAVYNLSDLDIKRGSTDYGKVALYANVFTEFTGSKVTTDGDYTFIATDIPTLFRYNGTAEKLTLPNNFNGERYNIANNAFEGNTTLTEVVIPAMSALNIGESAFEGCTSLKSIVINDLENSIGKAAFKGCTALTSVTFTNCHINEIADEAFMNCSSLLEITIPESVTRIGLGAFENCTSAVAITLGEKVQFIGAHAFEGTSSLKSAKIPDSVATFGVARIYGSNLDVWHYDYVFRGSGIESVEIGGGLRYLGGTFTDCVNLKRVTFAEESSLVDISYAFEGCLSLTTLKIPEGVTKAHYLLTNVLGVTSLYIPRSLVEAADTSGQSLYRTLCLRGNTYTVEAGYSKYTAPLTMYLPDLPKGATEEEITAFARKLAVFAAYSDYESLVAYMSSSGLELKDYTVFGNMTAVLSKEAYNAVHKVLSDTSEGNVYSTFVMLAQHFYQHDGLHRDDVLRHFYYVADVTYELYKLTVSQDALSTETVQKLAQNEGADIRYGLKTDKYGSAYYAIDENYTMPSAINGTNTGATWKVGTPTGADLDLATAKISGATTFVNLLGADDKLTANYENEYTKVYNGKPWTLAGTNLDGKAEITAMTLNGESVTDIVDVGTYTVTVAATNDYEFADGATTATFTVVINKAQATVVWTYKGEVLTEGNTESKEFDGKTVASELTLTYVDVNGDTKEIGKDLLRRLLNGTGISANASGEGLWTLYLSDEVLELPIAGDLRNYAFVHASHEFRIYNKQLSAQEVLTGLEIDVESESDLNDAMLYIYKDNSNNIVPSRTPRSEYTLVEVINVERSVVRYTNREWTLAAAVKPDSLAFFALDESKTENATQTAIGRQMTTFVLKAKDNYAFALNINAADAAARGLTFTASADGKTLTVTKTWYVVQLENELVMSNAASMENVYKIADWTYGDDVTVGLPRLWKGDEDASWAGDDSHVKFTLHKAGVADAIVSNAGRSTLLNYVNKYMPAGHYTLLVTVSSFDTEEASYPTFSRRYEFTVVEATIGIDESKLPKTEKGYADYEWELTANADKEQFFKKFADAIAGAGVLQTVALTPPEGEGNYWATDAGKEYFGDYEVKYNFARMNNEVYHEANHGDLAKLIAGGAQGTYTVYFQVERKNHVNLTDTSENARYNYFFTVTVWEKVATPAFDTSGLVYTGSKVLPDIAESALYNIVWSDTDDYIAGGVHSVSFTLTDKVHYKWADGNTDTVSTNFTIAKADNAWVRVPNIVNWTYDTFDTQINRIRAVVKFLDDGQSIKFSVVKADNSAITGLTDFAVKADGTIDGEALRIALNGLKVGSYRLKVTVAETDNYKALEQFVDFYVGKSMNAWADGNEDLVLPSWVVGKYNADENPIVVNAAHGNVNIVIADIDGNEYYNSVTGVNKLGECGVGKYLLRAWVDETEDYAALAERTFTIEVLEKIGLPWWGTLLIVIGALLVAAAIIFILWKKGVFQILTGKIVLAIRTRASVDATIASVRAAKMTEEGKQSVADAKRRERIEEMRKKAAEQRALPPEERAAQLEARAQAEAEKAEKSLARSEALKAKASKMRGGSEQEPKAEEKEEVAEEATEQAPAGEVAESEAAATNEAEE